MTAQTGGCVVQYCVLTVTGTREAPWLRRQVAPWLLRQVATLHRHSRLAPQKQCCAITTLTIKITISHISHFAPSPTPALLNTTCVQHL